MIIFVRTRYVYDSYTDFWELVKLSEFNTCYVDEIDISSENTYIITPINGEYRPHIAHQKNNQNKTWKAKLIWWNLERSIENIANDDIVDYVNEIWVSDRYYATLSKNFKFVILGSHPDLRLNKTDLPKIYDYSHISYVYGRREHLHHGLVKRGLKIAPSNWGKERDIALRSSKILVNIHQDAAPISEPLRFTVCAAYSLPIISETIQDPYPLINGTDIITINYDNLINTVVNYYNSDLTNMANSLHNKMCIENTFRICVERALTEGK